MGLHQIKQTGLYQTKKFWTMKETSNEMKRRPTEWEKIFTNNMSKTYKICKELTHFKIKNQTIWLKNGKLLNRHFKEDIQMANMYLKRSLTPLMSEWNVTSYMSEWQLSKRQELASIGKDVEKREPLCAIGENVNWCDHYGKQYDDSSKS